MTEIERKAKRLERGRYKMGYMKQFCSNEFKCSYEMPVVPPLSGDWQEATIPEVTEAKITTKKTPKGQLSASSSWSHTQLEPPFPSEPPRGIPGHCCQLRDGVSRHKDRGPCTNIPLDSLTSQHQLFHWHFTAHAPKPNLVFLAPIHSTEPSNKKMLVEEISFSFGLSAGRKTVKFTVRSPRQVGRRGQTRLNDHLNPECITID